MFITPNIDTTIQFVSIINSENNDIYYDTTFYQINCGQLSVNNYEHNYSLYPNPFYDKLMIDCPEKCNVIKIYDINGRLQKYSVVKNNIVTNLEDLKSGNYIISLEFKDKVITKKLIKL